MTRSDNYPAPASYTPKSFDEALETLTTWFALDHGYLSQMDQKALLKVWNAAACVFPGIHPDEVNPAPESISRIEDLPDGVPPCLRDYDEESGWPIALIPIAMEMWQRYEAGSLTDEEFYCVEAAMVTIATR